MLTRLARTYIYLLVAMMSLLLALLVTVHVALLGGNNFALNGRIFALCFAINFPALALAKDRNIWANELKLVSYWVRTIVVGLCLYSLAIFLMVCFMNPLNGGELIATAFFIAFSAGTICVPLILLKSAYATDEERLKRVQASFYLSITMAIFFGFAQWSANRISIPHHV